ncbi:DUF1365 domain-containing protein [Pseudovibrio japonicus]|uniref:DUF1365 domain-containing protein n=1 Tax=Pseudovibrio japonicus TaxID=366534 RepID=A0ABQ3E8H0_9HYPH|nr:DUF1365 domain-containing protein [Pseudovibrio japonicus]GHB29862.1 DUF1365 domain-containing protein [Pseudovibrio japonicus]
MILTGRQQHSISAPLTIYQGKVVHCRHDRIKHNLNYKAVCFLIDIDRLQNVDHMSPLLSVDRFNLFSFYPTDHMKSGHTSLRGYVEDMLQQAQITDVPEQIRLLAYPRFMGSAFNPISVFYCYSKNRLEAILYQVRNTFGDMHHYAIKITPSQSMGTQQVFRHACPKNLHVSPFIDLSGQYNFVVRPPTDHVSLIIRLTQGNAPVLTASFQGKQKQATTGRLLKLALQYFQVSAKVLGLIHFEALKLWIKGARFYKRPPPPADIVTSMHTICPGKTARKTQGETHDT